ncbi:hypothetical protein B296_00027740 [Ensete ventricosum]|uniref:Uncharacterized protein n=1 Tax=Ensete ventricosum TaxID=4639 RepID=A0A426ZM53_ENSVE|nr:hypothetical protein B296_00027740 [Ensete ventricosum]
MANEPAEGDRSSHHPDEAASARGIILATRHAKAKDRAVTRAHAAASFSRGLPPAPRYSNLSRQRKSRIRSA